MNEALKTTPGKPKSSRQRAVALARLIGLNGDDGNKKPSLDKRIEQRLQYQQEQNQLNVEAVVRHSILHSHNDVASQDPDPDWLHQFLAQAERVHSPQMQELWGKILATELSQPGAFSLRTLNILREMTQADAQMLGRAVALSTTLNQEGHYKIVLGYRREAAYGGLVKADRPTLSLSSFGLPYTSVLSLREMGMLFAAELETGPLGGQPFRLKLLGQNLSFQPKTKRLRLCYYRFTPQGQELAKLVQDTADTHYIAALSQLLMKDFTLL